MTKFYMTSDTVELNKDGILTCKTPESIQLSELMRPINIDISNELYAEVNVDNYKEVLYLHRRCVGDSNEFIIPIVIGFYDASTFRIVYQPQSSDVTKTSDRHYELRAPNIVVNYMRTDPTSLSLWGNAFVDYATVDLIGTTGIQHTLTIEDIDHFYGYVLTKTVDTPTCGYCGKAGLQAHFARRSKEV